MPKKSDTLKQERAAHEAKMKPLVEKAAADLSSEERTTLDGYYTELENMDATIKLQVKNENFEENRAARGGQDLSEKDKKDVQKFSFARAIRLLANGNNDVEKLDGVEREMHDEAVKEALAANRTVKGMGIPMMVLGNSRASLGQNVTTAADGGNLVSDDPVMFIEALQNALVLTGLGARMLPGLVGNLPLLKGGSFTAAWIAEDGNVSFTKESFSKATMSPKMLAVAGVLSKQLLAQTVGVAEGLVRADLIRAIAQGIQNAAINGTGANNQPTGILNTTGIGSVEGGTNGLAPTWGKIVDLETEISNDNAQLGDIAYLTNSKVRGKLKQTLKASGVAGFIWDKEGMNGYNAVVSNSVPSNLTKGTSEDVCSAIIGGVWSELFIGLWGGLDITVDPYTRADYGELKIVINQFADVALRNSESFAAMKDALTA